MYILKDEFKLEIIHKLSQRFEDGFLGTEMVCDILNVFLDKEIIAEALQFLYDDKILKFQFLSLLGGMHYPDRNSLGVVYHLHSFRNNIRIRIKIEVPIENPIVPTVVSVFATANWQERETYDFFGVIFEGHPNLIRILNVDDMEVFPLRKDIRLEDGTREDKNDAMFGR